MECYEGFSPKLLKTPGPMVDRFWGQHSASQPRAKGRGHCQARSVAIGDLHKEAVGQRVAQKGEYFAGGIETRKNQPKSNRSARMISDLFTITYEIFKVLKPAGSTRVSKKAYWI
jgi:hypothetical protein